MYKYVLILTVFIVVIIYYYRHYFARFFSLKFNRCQSLNELDYLLCNNNIFIENDDMSGPANSSRLGISWEGWMEPYIKKYCHSNAIAIDIGAHIGIHTQKMAEYAGYVIAFEPNPKTFKTLVLNTALYPNVHILNLGVSDKNKMSRFKQDPVTSLSKIDNTCPHQLNKEDGLYKEIVVELIALDKLFSSKSSVPISFIKIDIEGHELPAFKGMKNLIDNHRPVIIYEDHTGDNTRYLQEKHSYKITKINETNFLAY